MNPVPYRLIEVSSPALVRAWLDLPKRLYRDDPNWVCPLDCDVEAVFDPARNELFAGGEAVRWIVRDAEETVVGRIAAFYNREKAALESQPTGGCGFFECIDRQEAADLLFDAARDWLAARGMEAMDGPVNFGQRSDWWGLLVEGYEFQPLYKNSYNPPYYKELFERYGFRNYFNQNSYVWQTNVSEANARIFDRSERLLSMPGYRIETLDTKHLEAEAEHFRQIYNRAWALFSGVKPMTQEEAMHLLRTMRPILDPEIVFFAYRYDEPIGFFVSVPDLNRIIGKFRGRFGLVQKLRLMWDLKVRRSSDRIFGLIFGIAPEFHGKGVESAIMVRYWHFMMAHQRRYKSLELAWIGDFNPVMNRMIEHYVGATRHKMHTTYRYLFDRTKEFSRCPRLDLRRPASQQEVPDGEGLPAKSGNND